MKLSRRMFLGGAGAVVALPFLESLLPRMARGAAAAVPKRFVGFFVPNGIEMDSVALASVNAVYAPSQYEI